MMLLLFYLAIWLLLLFRYQDILILYQFLHFEFKQNDFHFFKTISSIYSICSSFVSCYFFSQNTKLHNKKYYDISYFFKNTPYIIRFYHKKGPRPIFRIKITTDNHIDVTDKIIPFLGPDLNWHNQIYFPELFGFSSLYFHIDEKQVAEFTSCQPIPSIIHMIS